MQKGGLIGFFSISEKDLFDLKALAAHLRAGLASRLFLSVVVFFLLVMMKHVVTALAFGFGIILNEAIELALFGALPRTASRQRTLAGWIMVNWFFGCSAWAIVAAHVWIEGRAPEKMLAISLAVGGLVHVAFNFSHWSKAVVVGTIPFVLGLAAMAVDTMYLDFLPREKALVVLSFVGLVFYLSFAAYTAVSSQRQLARALQQASAASEAKSVFLANMSHELRTPLNGIVGMSAMLKRTELSQDQSEMLDLIDSSSDSLVRVIGSILDLSKVEAGELNLELRPFCVADMLQTVAQASEFRAEEKGLLFRYDPTNELNTWLEGDDVRIRQLVDQLILNAIKFTDEGWVRMKAFVSQSSTPGIKYLIVEISDSGPGIDESEQSVIFSPFYQLEGALSRNHGGMGLGLTIVQKLADQMGGHLLLESAKGKGATFTFTVALRVAERPELVDNVPVSPEPAAPEYTRVLVAEDNPNNRRVIGRMLQAMGYLVEYAEDGAQAFEMYCVSPPDIVLMDIQMPVMNGIESFHNIRSFERDNGLTQTPVIAVTANAMAHQVEQYMWEGFSDVVTKPIDILSLSEALFKNMPAHHVPMA